MVRAHQRKLQSLQQDLVVGTRPLATYAHWKTCTSIARHFYFPLPLINTATKHPVQITASIIHIQRSPFTKERMGIQGYIKRIFSHCAGWICNALIFKPT